jgi:hypothetical protein
MKQYGNPQLTASEYRSSKGREGIMKLTLIGVLLASGVGAETKTVTWTGWFADAKCHSPGVAAGSLKAPNQECARTCIEKGAAPVFISEQAKIRYQVKDYRTVLDDLGYHVEVVGRVDETAGTLSVEKVTQLSPDGAACERLKKK